jgi:hypothetical protein
MQRAFAFVFRVESYLLFSSSADSPPSCICIVSCCNSVADGEICYLLYISRRRRDVAFFILSVVGSGVTYFLYSSRRRRDNAFLVHLAWTVRYHISCASVVDDRYGISCTYLIIGEVTYFLYISRRPRGSIFLARLSWTGNYNAFCSYIMRAVTYFVYLSRKRQNV